MSIFDDNRANGGDNWQKRPERWHICNEPNATVICDQHEYMQRIFNKLLDIELLLKQIRLDK